MLEELPIGAGIAVLFMFYLGYGGYIIGYVSFSQNKGICLFINTSWIHRMFVFFKFLNPFRDSKKIIF